MRVVLEEAGGAVMSAASTIIKPAIWFRASTMPVLVTRLVLPTMTSVATMAAALRLPHSSHAFKPALSVASCSDLGCARKAARSSGFMV